MAIGATGGASRLAPAPSALTALAPAAGAVLSLARTPLLAVPFDFRPRDAADDHRASILMGATLAATLEIGCRAAMTDPAVLRDE